MRRRQISQLIVPIVDGGIGVSSFFDIDKPTKRSAAKLRVMSQKVLPGGVRWMRYRVV